MYRKLICILVLISLFGLKFSKTFAGISLKMNSPVYSVSFEKINDQTSNHAETPVPGDEDKEIKLSEFTDDDLIGFCDMKMFYVPVSSQLYIAGQLRCPDPVTSAVYSPPEYLDFLL